MTIGLSTFAAFQIPIVHGGRRAEPAIPIQSLRYVSRRDRWATGTTTDSGLDNLDSAQATLLHHGDRFNEQRERAALLRPHLNDTASFLLYSSRSVSLIHGQRKWLFAINILAPSIASISGFVYQSFGVAM